MNSIGKLDRYNRVDPSIFHYLS